MTPSTGSPLSVKAATGRPVVPDTGEQHRTTPLSTALPGFEPASNSAQKLSLKSNFDQRPFSPLTLDELGLHPPPTPSALLDIGTPVSLSKSETVVAVAPTSANTLDFKDLLRADTVRDGEKDSGCVKMLDVESPSTALRNVSENPGSTASPVAYHDPLLTSFLQSLGEDPQMPASSTTSVVDNTGASGVELTDTTKFAPTTPDKTAAVVKDTAEGQFILSRFTTSNVNAANDAPCTSSNANAPQFPERRSESGSRHLFPAATSTASHTSSYWSAPQRSSSKDLSCGAQNESSSTPIFPSNGARGAPGSKADRPDNIVPSWASFLPFVSDSFLVTSSPLERDCVSAQSAVGTETPNQPPTLHRRYVPTAASSKGSSSTSSWPLDLTSLSQFALPQAPPLQPEHRYPISILESEGHEPDPETDRESEVGQQADVSPSQSSSSATATRPKQSMKAAIKRKSTETTQGDNQSMSTGFSRSLSPKGGQSKALISPSSPQKHGGSQSTPNHLEGAEGNLFRIVPLSNVVRSRSWSSASHSSSGSHEATPWLAGSNEALQTEHRTRVGSSVNPAQPNRNAASPANHVSRDPLSSLRAPTSIAQIAPSIPTSTAGASSERSGSHDFTRQALLDFIRRTNLGMASNAPSDGPGSSASSKALPTSKELGAGPEVPARTSSMTQAGWSSSVPAELQAHLQNWQHQRKRHRMQGDVAGQTSKDPMPSQSSSAPSDLTSRRSSLHNLSTTVQSEQQQQQRTSNKRSASESERDQKSRKQEHYQRLLLQLHVQMRMKMQMQMQRQKDLQEKTNLRDSLERKDEPSKGAEFRQPSPPSKSSLALKSATEGRKASIGSANLSDEFNARAHNEETSASVTVQSSTKNDGKEGDVRGASLSSTQLRGGSTTDDTAKSEAVTHTPSAAIDASWSRAIQSSDTSRWSGFAVTPTSLIPSAPAWPSVQPTSFSYPDASVGGTYSQPSTTLAHPWQTNQPAWYNAFGGGSGTMLSTQIPALRSWPTFTRPPPPVTSWDPPLATELMLKHPNWVRDMTTPSFTPLSAFPQSFSGSTPTPQFVDTSTFTISCATMSATTSQASWTDTTRQASTNEQQKIKRPFSPGEEVVFWAVKGGHSVKLVGTVESMTEGTANIVVPSQKTISDDAGQEICESRQSVDGSNKQDGRQDLSSASIERYKQISFDNIVAKDQATVLGFV